MTDELPVRLHRCYVVLGQLHTQNITMSTGIHWLLNSESIHAVWANASSVARNLTSLQYTIHATNHKRSKYSIR